MTFLLLFFVIVLPFKKDNAAMYTAAIIGQFARNSNCAVTSAERSIMGRLEISPWSLAIKGCHLLVKSRPSVPSPEPRGVVDQPR